MNEHDRQELWQGCTLLLALDSLTDAQRHAVLGRHWRGVSYRALAEERNVSKAAIYMAEQSGLKALRSRLDPTRMGVAA